MADDLETKQDEPTATEEPVVATEEDKDPVAAAYDANPVVQTFDKSAGDPSVGAPDYGNVVHQGGFAQNRTDGDEGRYDNKDGDYPAAPGLDLHNSTHTEVAPEPGEGVPDPVVAPDGPSVVEGKRDTVPNPSGQPLSLQEQIDKGIGTPSPNVETPGYVVPDGAPAGAPVVAAPIDTTQPDRC
jgi:hypothetical protein